MVHTAEGPVIDAAVVDARPPWPSGLSTPSGLKAAMVMCSVAIAVFGIVASRSAIDRRAAADHVVTRDARLLIDTQDLYVALADADAAASTIFLRAGLEPNELRQRYLDDLRRAGDRLAAIAGDDLGADAAAAAETLAEELPIYAGMVEAARTNSRLGHPVGAASLRRASELMRTTILPAATTIYEEAATRLDDRYRDGTTGGVVEAVAVTAALAVAAVVLTQVYVTSRSRRWLNAGLLVAVVAVVGAALATTFALRRQADALAESREDGAELVTALSTARILTLRSLSDDNLDLIERGTVPEYRDDFELRVASIGVGERDGLLDLAMDAAPDFPTRRALVSLEERYAAYLAAHDEVRRLHIERDYRAAVELAVSSESDAARELDTALADLIDGASATLAEEADQARGLAWLPIVIVLAAFAAAVAAVVGLLPRLREFR